MSEYFREIIYLKKWEKGKTEDGAGAVRLEHKRGVWQFCLLGGAECVSLPMPIYVVYEVEGLLVPVFLGMTVELEQRGLQIPEEKLRIIPKEGRLCGVVLGEKGNYLSGLCRHFPGELHYEELSFPDSGQPVAEADKEYPVKGKYPAKEEIPARDEYLAKEKFHAEESYTKRRASESVKDGYHEESHAKGEYSVEEEFPGEYSMKEKYPGKREYSMEEKYPGKREYSMKEKYPGKREYSMEEKYPGNNEYTVEKERPAKEAYPIQEEHPVKAEAPARGEYSVKWEIPAEEKLSQTEGRFSAEQESKNLQMQQPADQKTKGESRGRDRSRTEWRPLRKEEEEVSMEEFSTEETGTGPKWGGEKDPAQQQPSKGEEAAERERACPNCEFLRRKRDTAGKQPTPSEDRKKAESSDRAGGQTGAENMAETETGPAGEMSGEGDWEEEPLLRRMAEMYPFEDDEMDWCRQMEPSDISALPMQYWHYGKNSFLLHGFYNYRHLLYAGSRGKKYIGVPGQFHRREQYLAGRFGFPRFKGTKRKKVTLGDFGYWLREI